MISTTVVTYSITIFIVQFFFVGFRTWNITCIANKDIFGALLSGALVHIAYLISLGVSAVSMYEIIKNFELQYLPVLIASLLGGLLGTYIVMKK